MLSGNVCGGLELVRRPHNGRSGHGTTIFRALRGSAAVAARCEFSCPQLRFERSERVVSSQTTASTPRVVMGPKDAQQKLFLSRFTSRTRSPHAQASFTCPGGGLLRPARRPARSVPWCRAGPLGCAVAAAQARRGDRPHVAGAIAGPGHVAAGRGRVAGLLASVAGILAHAGVRNLPELQPGRQVSRVPPGPRRHHVPGPRGSPGVPRRDLGFDHGASRGFEHVPGGNLPWLLQSSGESSERSRHRWDSNPR